MRVGEILLGAERRHPFHPVEVCSGAKALPGAGEHDEAHVRIVVERHERCGQVADQRLVERIVELGSIERHRRDRVANRDIARAIHGARL